VTQYLKIHTYSAEPYDLDLYDLSEAIGAEARTISLEAGSDLLDEGTEQEREELRQHVIEQAERSLHQPDDTYIDPTGVRWSIIEEKD
jgi:hypothetical protein